MRECYVQTYSGYAFPLHNPKPNDVIWMDIAWSLAQSCRFNGHTNQFYSVAQHSVLVALMLPPEYRIYGLLHDAHEAYSGDIINPVKFALGATALQPLLDMQSRLDAAIFKKAGLSLSKLQEAFDLIDTADRVALATEARDVICDWSQPFDVSPLNRVIKPMSPPQAADAWLLAFEDMRPQ